MSYITNSSTPVYKRGPEFYSFVRSIPVNTTVKFSSYGIDPKSNRAIGILSDGNVMYLDALTKMLDEIIVKDTRIMKNKYLIVTVVIIAVVVIVAYIQVSKSK